MKWICASGLLMKYQLVQMHARDGLVQGELAGGKTGKNLRYKLPNVRGDLIRYVSGKEEDCHNIGLLSEIVDQVILQLQEEVRKKFMSIVNYGLNALLDLNLCVMLVNNQSNRR